MGEFDEEAEIGPEGAEPAAAQAEPSPTVGEAEEPVVPEDPIAAIQEQLTLDETGQDDYVQDPADATSDAGEPSAHAAPESDAAVDETPDDGQPGSSRENADERAIETSEDPDAVTVVAEDEGAAEPEGVSTDAASETEAEEEDDLTAAIAASNEQVGTDSTPSGVADTAIHPASADGATEEVGPRYGAPWWPFLIYVALWVAFAGVAVWQFEQLPAGAVAYESELYTMFVFGGLALGASGVFLTLAVWLGSRLSPKRARAGLFTSALIKGSVSILLGIVLWWGTLMVLDYLRLGRLF